MFSGSAWGWSTASRQRTDIWLYTRKSQPSLSQIEQTHITWCKTDWSSHSDAASSMTIVNLRLLRPHQEQSSQHLCKITHPVILLKTRSQHKVSAKRSGRLKSPLPFPPSAPLTLPCTFFLFGRKSQKSVPWLYGQFYIERWLSMHSLAEMHQLQAT